MSKTLHGIVDAPSSWKRASTAINTPTDINPLGAKIYTNPAAKDLWIELETITPQNTTIKVFDISGKLLIEQNAKITQGQNKLHLITDALSKDTYILQLESGGIMSKFSLMIE